MGIRDCPAAVCRNDRRHQALDHQVREATATRSIPTESGMGACESEDLPIVSGTPCPTVCRLVEWARADRQHLDHRSRTRGSYRDARSSGGRPPSDEHRRKPDVCSDSILIHRHRARLRTHRTEPRTEEGHRSLLGRAPRPQWPGIGCRTTARRHVVTSTHSRAGLDPGRNVLVLRPRPRHSSHARGVACPGRRYRRRPRPLFRRSTRHRRYCPTRDDQVVRHQLPLPRPRDRTRHRLRTRCHKDSG